MIQHISKSPAQQGLPSSWPVHLTGYAVSEAMGEVVSSVEFDGGNTLLPDSARRLYFSKRRNKGGLLGDGDVAFEVSEFFVVQ